MLSYVWPFRHPDNPNRPPMNLTMTAMTGEAGKRQSWLYTAEYYGGAKTEHICPCPVIPFELSRNSLIEKLRLLKRQPFKEICFKEKFPIIKDNIKKLLRQRKCVDEAVVWKYFFDNVLPSSIDDPRFCSVNSLLVDLVSNYTQNIQVTSNSNVLFALFLIYFLIKAKNGLKLYNCPKGIGLR